MRYAPVFFVLALLLVMLVLALVSDPLAPWDYVQQFLQSRG